MFSYSTKCKPDITRKKKKDNWAKAAALIFTPSGTKQKCKNILITVIENNGILKKKKGITYIVAFNGVWYFQYFQINYGCSLQQQQKKDSEGGVSLVISVLPF